MTNGITGNWPRQRPLADYCTVTDLCRASSIGTHGKKKVTNSDWRRQRYRRRADGFAVRHVTRLAIIFMKIKNESPPPAPCCCPAGPTNKKNPTVVVRHNRRSSPKAAWPQRQPPPGILAGRHRAWGRWPPRHEGGGGRTLEKESAGRIFSRRRRPHLEPTLPTPDLEHGSPRCRLEKKEAVGRILRRRRPDLERPLPARSWAITASRSHVVGEGKRGRRCQGRSRVQRHGRRSRGRRHGGGVGAAVPGEEESGVSAPWVE
jgi:hypothetical protein